MKTFELQLIVHPNQHGSGGYVGQAPMVYPSQQPATLFGQAPPVQTTPMSTVPYTSSTAHGL
jgi:hypothetical protein